VEEQKPAEVEAVKEKAEEPEIQEEESL